MPFSWVTEPNAAPDLSGASFYAAGDAPYAQLRLWPHNSLTPKGFAWFIGLTFALILFPLIAVLGSPVLWGILPFLLAMLCLLWWALKSSWRRNNVLEEMSLWSDRVEISHREPKGQVQEWTANPHWVQVKLHETGGPVANYVTLRGGGREVELGAFLSEEERQSLYAELRRLFRKS